MDQGARSAAPGGMLPRQGWYPDPAGIGRLRYWDGAAWADAVVVDGSVVSRPLPPVRPALGSVQAGSLVAPYLSSDTTESFAPLPPRAALLGLAGFGIGLVISLVVGLLGVALDLPVALVLVLAAAALWSGLLGACSLASRHFGTGSLSQDFSLRPAGSDLGWGVLVGIGARLAASLAAAPFFLAGETFRRGNLGALDRLDGDTAALVAFVVVAVIGAPLVEELFFRGLLQRAFYPVLGGVGAVTVQALLFGISHLNPALGMANFTVIAATAAAGVVFGFAARRRRLPTAMVGHAVFNGVVVLVVLVGLAST